MSFFITFDADNKLNGRYDSNVHLDNIPESAIEVEGNVFYQTMRETDGEWIFNPDGSISKRILVMSLDDLKAQKINELAAALQQTLQLGFMTSLQFQMDATLEALQKLKTAYDFAVLMSDATMAVVDYDNSAHVNVPIADVEKILKEVGGNYRSLYMTKQQLRGQVLAATTPEQVASVVWSHVVVL